MSVWQIGIKPLFFFHPSHCNNITSPDFTISTRSVLLTAKQYQASSRRWKAPCARQKKQNKGPSEGMVSWHLHYVSRWRSVSVITRVIIESIVLRQPRGDACDTWSFCVIKWETEAEKEIKRAGNILLGSSQMLQVSIETPHTSHSSLFSLHFIIYFVVSGPNNLIKAKAR